ncbi:capsule assembly Wzi family protein [Dyadobacter helix]|nr:capsule assembly Wzi family protein [Dyadobacter sp. CECT 9275]
MRSNQFGSVPNSGSYISGKVAVYKRFHPGDPRFFQWAAGSEVIANLAKSKNLFFTDLFVSGRAGPVELSLGQRKETGGLGGDSLLTSGPIAMSGNSRPFPKMQLCTPNYVTLVPEFELLAIKFSYSDGLLGPAGIGYGNVSAVKNIYLHKKSFYLRIGKPENRLHLLGGFNHQAIWGGEDKIFSGGLSPKVAYKYVVFGKSWSGSRVGNHFGTIDLAAEWKGKIWDIFLYRQSIYEDGSLINLSNIADGLNGLQIRKAAEKSRGFSLSTLLFELLYTKNQGGSVFNFNTSTFGRDNYFNHYVYNQGWSYRGESLGTPLIGPQNFTKEALQTKNSKTFTVNNRIIAFHAGLRGTFHTLNFLFKSTYSINFGTYDNPFQKQVSQTSFLLGLEKRIPFLNGCLINLGIASDLGDLYPKSFASIIGLKKTGFLN